MVASLRRWPHSENCVTFLIRLKLELRSVHRSANKELAQARRGQLAIFNHTSLTAAIMIPVAGACGEKTCRAPAFFAGSLLCLRLRSPTAVQRRRKDFFSTTASGKRF
jgi:hypothetical protein